MGEIRQVFFGAWVALILGMGVGTAAAGVVPEALYDKASSEGSVRVIVQLRVTTIPEGHLESTNAVASQRQDIATMRSAVLAELAGTGYRTIREFETIPFVALEVAPDAMAALEASPNVVGVEEDRLLSPHLSQSVPLIGANQAWAAGFDGAGIVVAILDSGVDKNHPFLSGKVVEEACFSGNGNCPNGLTSQTGPGAGVPCTYAPNGCRHGTHVAGIAAGSGAGAGVSFSGVAKGARIMAVQVFSRVTGSACTGQGEDPCALASTSDVIAGGERVLALSGQHTIAAVNVSLGGGGKFTSPCDSALPAGKAIIDNLRSVGIATVIASGNDGFADGLLFPACISTAVSVGNTTKSDTVFSSSNSATFLSLLAPGSSINSSVPGGGFAFLSGTSMATPHVTGAWAILKQKKPTATVDEVLTALTSTGLLITDPKNGIAKPRIRVNQALQAIGPSTPVTAVSLTPDKSSPQPLGTTILWTAGVTGGTAPQFQFWVQPVGGPFTLLCAYSSSNTCPWTPSVAGDYFVFVWARSTGSSAIFEADALVAFQVVTTCSPVTAVSLTPDKPSPQPVLTTIVWTAGATGGCSPQFQFWVQPVGGPLQLRQPYGSSNTFAWTPNVAGDYFIFVWARTAGSSAIFEADRVISFTASSSPVTAVSLTPNKPSPQLVGTTIVFTAVATGGAAPQFQFWVQRVGGPFTLLCAYSSGATCAWTPSVAGDYFVFVWARSGGASVAFEADRVISFTATSGSVTAVSLTPDKPSPQPIGTTIVFTAVATGGTAPQFQFWVQRVGEPFTLLCAYSSSPTCPWTPSVAGDYFILVWARSAGSSAIFEADRVISFTAAPTPVTAVSLTPDKPSPQPVGTTIVFTAVATGGTAPQFQFWVQRVGAPFTSPFTLLCAYSSSTTCAWTPSVAGDYFILVQARSSGAGVAFEAEREIPFRLEHL